jgi:hypothetical protein
MLCAICGQDNELGSPRCFQCRNSLLPESQETPLPSTQRAENTPLTGLYGFVGLALSIVAFQLVAPYLFSPPTSGINLIRLVSAGVFGAAGMFAGKRFARWLAEHAKNKAPE